jgi:hypothetical protein
MEAPMTRKLTRTGIAAIVLAGAAFAGSSLPAQAAARPGVAPGTEYVINYYSNGQHTTLVGQIQFGCVTGSWGSRTDFYVSQTYAC